MSNSPSVLHHILNLMRFSKAISQNLRCDKVTINEYKTANINIKKLNSLKRCVRTTVINSQN